jgi:hypothetical protein
MDHWFDPRATRNMSHGVDGHASLHISAQPSASRSDDAEDGRFRREKQSLHTFAHELCFSRCEPLP